MINRLVWYLMKENLSIVLALQKERKKIPGLLAEEPVDPGKSRCMPMKLQLFG